MNETSITALHEVTVLRVLHLEPFDQTDSSGGSDSPED